MKIHTFAVGFLTAAMAGQIVPGRVWGVEVPGPNAAATYRQAFDAADKTDLAKSPVMAQDVGITPLNDAAKKTLDANQESVDLIRRARGEATADWGDVSDMNKVLAELGRARMASHLMVLQARQDLKDKQDMAAVDDWLSDIAMARHVGAMNLLVARLVATAVESQAIDQATAALPTLPDEAKQALVNGWRSLPKVPTGHDMMMGEYAYAQQAVVKQNLTKEWVTILEPFYKTIADAADGPPDQFEKVVDEQMAKFKLNPFAQTLGPSLKRSRVSLAKVEEKRSVFEKALGITP